MDTARPGEKPAVPEKSAEALKNEQADLGFVVLSRFSPNSFEFQQMLDSWRKRLGKADEYRDFLMNLYQGFAGNALSPNYCGWDRKGRIERLPKELAARFTDWRTNMQGLAKFGLHSSADSEITALQKLLKLHKTDTAVYPVEIERRSVIIPPLPRSARGSALRCWNWTGSFRRFSVSRNSATRRGVPSARMN